MREIASLRMLDCWSVIACRRRSRHLPVRVRRLIRRLKRSRRKSPYPSVAQSYISVPRLSQVAEWLLLPVPAHKLNWVAWGVSLPPHWKSVLRLKFVWPNWVIDSSTLSWPLLLWWWLPVGCAAMVYGPWSRWESVWQLPLFLKDCLPSLRLLSPLACCAWQGKKRSCAGWARLKLSAAPL